FEHRPQPLWGNVLDVRIAGSQLPGLAWIGVHSDHIAALLGEGHRKRQPHIAEPDDADGRHRRGVYARPVTACSSRRSASTMRATSCSKLTRGSHPSCVRALPGSPTLTVRSGARTSFGSTRT